VRDKVSRPQLIFGVLEKGTVDDERVLQRKINQNAIPVGHAVDKLLLYLVQGETCAGTEEYGGSGAREVAHESIAILRRTFGGLREIPMQ